jgi:hypothetical protein
MVSDTGPEWIVAYPGGGKPLLVKVADPTKCAWLPENEHKDYMIYCGPGEKYVVSSPGCGFSKYVAWQQL